MADLLTHVLFAYVLVTAARWRFDVSRRWIPVAMGGAAIPDLSRVRLLVPEATVENALGLEFTYMPVESLAGLVLVGAAITLAFDRRYWRRAYTVLLFGGATSLLLDGMRVYADGHAGFWLYPIPWRPPTANLYVSSDPRIPIAAVAVAVVVAILDGFAFDRDET